LTIAELDAIQPSDFVAHIERCCGSSRWVAEMQNRRPYKDATTLHQTADQVWASMHREDILEAFSHHPQIGANVASLREKFSNTAAWSASEQSGVAAADEGTLQSLAKANQAYVNKFGYIFIVCASGQTAASMLAMLQERLSNDPAVELKIAAAEQAKIMHLRLNKLLDLS
jgi:2-oxo-4-hydroxy-4-carboxy-5-ureidoimidazoline decarboxylase